ncbi:MAG: hypothetical protein LUH22_05590 [Bacteroides sp.]|nr:hypothetical protein [Bacteroides sp.]
MNSGKIPATPETRKSLYENMGKTIEVSSPVLKKLIIIKDALNTNSGDKEYKILEALLSLEIFNQYFNIELSSILRACFRANQPAEKRYNIKYINCVIIESYKHLYGYKKLINKSLWVSKIKPLLKIINEQDFKQDFSILENQIVEFGQRDITDKGKRDLSFHYDSEPLSVYLMLMELSEEDEAQRVMCFMDLLKSISVFTLKYIGKYKVHADVDHEDTLSYAFTLSDLDIFKNSKDVFYSTLESVINSHAERLDKFVRQQNIPVWIKQQYKEVDEELITPFRQFSELGKVAIQLTYIYLDLASALRAFLSSEYTIEKQLSLKQVNTIVYEGFNKLYGLNVNPENSFWSKYITPLISENTDPSLCNEYEVLSEELLKLKQVIEKLEEQRQLSVHYHEGIVKVYNMLHDLNPIKEFQKALQLLNILPKVLNFCTKCLHMIDLKNQTNHEKRMASTYKTIDNIMELLGKAPNNQQKADMIKNLERIKTGEFFDEIIYRPKK